MQLYILRHGDAPYDSCSGQRRLSSFGEQQVAQVVEQRSEELSGVTHIICSPSLRARETFAVLNKNLSMDAPFLLDDCLRSESSVGRVESFIHGFSEQDNLLLISHQPLVGDLCRYLLDAQHDTWFFGTANLAALKLITFARGCGELQWLDTP